jgi:hypothetical protein
MPLNFLEQLLMPLIVLVLLGTILGSYLLFKKTQSIPQSLWPTMIPPVGTFVMIILVQVLNTDPSGWVGLGQMIIAIVGMSVSVLVFAITALMLFILKKNLK